MRLLVTGGAGYIGSVCAARLLDVGHEVTVLDNLERGHRSAVPEAARLVEVDLLDVASLNDVLAEGFDGVLHLAAVALVGESVGRPEHYWRTNVGGTLNLLEAMRAGGVPRLVFSSTCACYGVPETVPIHEELPERPVNPYGQSKLAVDRMIADHARAHGLGSVSLRYFNAAGANGPYGEHHEPETHLIPNVLFAALGRSEHVTLHGTDYPTRDGSAIRDYVHVKDLADAHLRALDRCTPGEHVIYNLGTGTGYSVREVIEAARRVTGREIPVVEGPRRPGDPPALVAANDKVRRELGWAPAHDGLETIIADAWAWHQANPNGYSS